MTSSETTTALAQQHGVLVLDKPSGPTSTHCLSRIKRLGQKKIGHAGTLDPMASGVLLVLLGQATKLSGFLLESGSKVYEAEVELGRETDTWDAEGETVQTPAWDHVTPARLSEVVASWHGDLEQIVPPYSAAKSNGQPLYRLARAGKAVPVKTKTVHISRAEILSVDLPLFRFRVTCSSGTYIRSLAHSLGMRLSCGATLTSLTRKYSHPFGLDEAVSLDTLLGDPSCLPQHVHSMERALAGWPVVHLDGNQARRVRNGMPVVCPAESLEAVCRNRGQALLRDEQDILALARLDREGARPMLTVARGLWL